MHESPFDEPQALDGIVGLVRESNEPPPSQSSRQVHVSVSGDARHASWAMGLEDDVRLLAEAVAAGGASLCRERAESLVTPSSGRSRASDEYEEVHVRLHGLRVDPEDEDELCNVVRSLVRERITHTELLP